MAEVRVFTPGRSTLGVLPGVKGVKVAWKRNGAAAAAWAVPSNATLPEELLNMCNLIEVQDARLPVPWIGQLLDQASSETEPGLTALSAESLYSTRMTSIDWYLENPLTAGSLIGLLHDEATRVAPLAILSGDLDVSGDTVGIAELYSGQPLTPIDLLIGQVATWSGGDWWVEKQGLLPNDPWWLRFARQRGRDLSGSVVLSSDVTDWPEYKVSGGGLATAMYALGAGITDDPADHIALYLMDRTALADGRSVVDTYGLREVKVEYPDVYNADLLYTVAARDLARMSRPARMIGVNIDDRSGNWGAFWLGDTVRLILARVRHDGLDIRAVVDAIEVDLDAGKMGVVLEILEPTIAGPLISRQEPR